ncbi:MAG: enoyl-CoA hydratase/isomerase family protein [Planctomycetota bacterium]
MSEHVLYHAENGVGRITLDRTNSRNALTRAMIERISQFVTEAAADTKVRLIVLAANGTVFCAGMDLGEMQERAASENAPEEWMRDSEVYSDLLKKLLNAPKPVLAAVQGPVLAGGVGMVLSCDLVIATERTFFALPEPQRGIVAAMVTPLLAFRAGVGHASHLLLSGRRMTAEQALTAGLCHGAYTIEEFDNAEQEWIDSILTGSPEALALTKKQLCEVGGASLLAQLDAATIVSAVARKSDDAREGLQAFLEKRKPAWQPHND